MNYFSSPKSRVTIITTTIFLIINFGSAFALDYDPTYPPTLFPAKVIREKGYEVFQFIGKDLLIPDKVEYDEGIYEIVQEGEEDRFETIAVFELNVLFDSQKVKASQSKDEVKNVEKQELPDPLLAYKQSMWARGLEIASRNYKISRYEVIRSDGFKVDFKEGISGRISATVTLYKSKPELLEEIKVELKNLKIEVQRLQNNIMEWSSEINKNISEVKDKSDSLQMKIASVENISQSHTKQLQAIKDDLQNLESKINDLFKKSP